MACERGSLGPCFSKITKFRMLIADNSDGREKGRSTRLDREGTLGRPLRFNSRHQKLPRRQNAWPMCDCVSLSLGALAEVWGAPAGSHRLTANMAPVFHSFPHPVGPHPLSIKSWGMFPRPLNPDWPLNLDFKMLCALPPSHLGPCFPHEKEPRFTSWRTRDRVEQS